jgi:hypothetical protein
MALQSEVHPRARAARFWLQDPDGGPIEDPPKPSEPNVPVKDPPGAGDPPTKEPPQGPDDVEGPVRDPRVPGQPTRKEVD